MQREAGVVPTTPIQMSNSEPTSVDPVEPIGPKTPARLWEEHVSSDARLFADRRQILSLLKSGCIFAEVGVGLGDFSRYVLDVLCPSRFHAIDVFNLHEEKELWRRPASETFGSLTHEQFYRKQISAHVKACEVKILKGDSTQLLSGFAPSSVDAIYLDATHLYENVAAELHESARIVKEDGLIILNDYMMYDHLTMSKYGVIQATNEFIVENGWEVVAFALQQEMFCDIAIRRKQRDM